MDQFFNLTNPKNEKYQLRFLVYFGYILRKIFQDEVVKEYGWYVMKTRTGRDFTGQALRGGMGISQFIKIRNRYYFEPSVGFGLGNYFKTADNNISSNDFVSKQFVDFRFAINFCYKLF